MGECVFICMCLNEWVRIFLCVRKRKMVSQQILNEHMKESASEYVSE